MIGVNNLITPSNLNPAKVNISVVEYFPSIQNLLRTQASAMVQLFCCTGVLYTNLNQSGDSILFVFDQ